MKVLGINWEQNATAALVIDGEVSGCLSEERVSRSKNDERYPIHSIDWLLERNAVGAEDLDAVVFVSTMWSPGYILTRHYTGFTVRDYIAEQYQIWKPRLLEGKDVSQLKVFSERIDYDQFPGREYWKNVVESLDGDSAHVSSEGASEYGVKIRKEVVHRHLGLSLDKIFFADHSLSHACYAYYLTPPKFRHGDHLVLTMDAFGDNINYSARVFSSIGGAVTDRVICQGNDFIIGRLYRYITLILGLKPNEHEYKVMGLAPYCKEQYYDKLLERFKTFQEVEGTHFKFNNKPTDMYFSIREMLEGERFDTICGALQAYTEYLVIKWVKNLIKKTGIKKISLAGGVAMNVKANMLVAQIPEVDYVYIPPSPDDSSQSMGAAYAWLHKNTNENSSLLCQNYAPYQGRGVGSGGIKQIEALITEQYQDYSLYISITPYDVYSVAKLLADGKLVARCSGNEEFGARALGNRSILADPRHSSIKKIINEKVKNRDFWMPFACSVIEERCDEYFKLDSDYDSYRYMTLCCNTTDKGSKLLQAAIHPYDETCRPQIVSNSLNPSYHELICRFGELTNVYALLNTSLNHHGAPIVSTAADALDVFFKSDLDCLILDQVLVKKVK
jgi:carbamoyltransferase